MLSPCKPFFQFFLSSEFNYHFVEIFRKLADFIKSIRMNCLAQIPCSHPFDSTHHLMNRFSIATGQVNGSYNSKTKYNKGGTEAVNIVLPENIVNIIQTHFQVNVPKKLIAYHYRKKNIVRLFAANFLFLNSIFFIC